MFFSIIVPVYNVERYIKRCLDSILAQSYKDFECIVVDDGSTDRSGIISDDYAYQDARIKVIHKVNGGLSSARNAGLDIASGLYVLFCDSDDWIEKDTLFELKGVLDRDLSDVVIFGWKRIFKNKEEIEIFPENENIQKIKDLLLTNQWACSACNKCISRELIGYKRFPFGVFFEDLAFIPQLIFNADKIKVIEKSFYNYDFTRDDSITKDVQSNKMIHFFLAQLGNFEFAKAFNRKCTYYLLCYALRTAYDCLLLNINDKKLSDEQRRILQDIIRRYEVDVSQKVIQKDELKLKYHYYHNKARYYSRTHRHKDACKAYVEYIIQKIKYMLVKYGI